MKRAIVIGASSGLGRQVAQLLIQEGWHVGLAARRVEVLNELKNLAPDRIFTVKLDVSQSASKATLHRLINELGGMNLFFYAAGIGWQNPCLEEEKEIATTETNALGFVRMIGEAYRYFAKNAGGHIAAITSIASTRGLGPAPAYSATKALQKSYLEALQQQAFKRFLPITITDIRPGFVATDLLNDGAHYPMLMSKARVAEHAVEAVIKKKSVATIDWRYRILVALWRLVPHRIWRKMRIATSNNK